jgi:hypothetical protein
MSEATVLIAYPGIWAASVALHPRDNSAYSWQDHLRSLCHLCRGFWASRAKSKTGIPWAILPVAEQLHIAALGTVDAEMLILDLVADQVARPTKPWHTKWGPLWFLDPYDSHLLEPAPVDRRAPEARI